MHMKMWMMAAALLAAFQSGAVVGDEPPPLRSGFAFEARVIVPILGGPVKGPLLNGQEYEWMNHTLFIGSVERQPDAAIVSFYKVE